MNHDVTTPGGSPGRSVVRALSVGFGVTVLMWLLSYVAMLQPGAQIGEVLFVVTVLLLVAGSALGAMLDGSGGGIRRGIEVGFISACINLLLVGSLVGGKAGSETGAVASAWFAGLFGASIVLGAIGGWIGSFFKPLPTQRINWVGAFAAVCAVLTFLMIVTGGIVTGFEAGLAVPDWPNSYGHNMLLYPLTEMIADLDSGIYYEHAHRLTGMFVGIASITLCVVLWFGDRRSCVGWLGSLVLLMVIGQGVLGGLRVTEINMAFGIVHGVFGQVILGCLVLVAAMTSWRWMHGDAPSPTTSAGAGRTLAWILLAALLLQLVIGAIYRHLGSDLGFDVGRTVHILMAHIALAALVALLAVINGIRGMLMPEGRPVMRHIGLALLILVSLQLLLGIAATLAVFSHEPGMPVPVFEVLVTSAHQANGALLLGAAVLMIAWTCRSTITPEPGEVVEAPAAA